MEKLRSASAADEATTSVQFSTTVVLGAQEIPLSSGPLNVSELKGSKEEVTNKLKEWIKQQTFGFPPGYQLTWSVQELVVWLNEKAGGDPLPQALLDVFDEEITITNCSVSGNGTFSISFLVTFNSGTVDLAGFPLGVKRVGFSVAHTKSSS